MADISQMSDADLMSIAGVGEATSPVGAPKPAMDLSSIPDEKLQQIAAAPKPSFGSALEYGIANAVPFSHDIGAAIQAGESYLPKALQADDTGEVDPNSTFGQRFAQQRGRINATDAADRQAYPVTSFVTPLAASAAALPVAGPIDALSAGITGLAPRLAGAAADTLASGAVGAGYGAAYGAGTGDSLGERLGNAAEGATFGGVGGAAAPLVAKGIIGTGKAAANLVKGYINPEAAGRDIAINQVAADQAAGTGTLMSPQDIDASQNMGQPVVLGDLGGQPARRLARAIANKSPDAQAALTAPLNERFLSQNTRLPDFVQDMYGANMNDPAKIQAALDANKAATNTPAYRQAYSDGASGVWTPDLESMIQSPAVQTAIKGATTRAANDAVINGTPVARNPFVADTDGNLGLRTNPDGSQAIPTLQFWDTVKRGLDDQIGAAFSSGNKSTGAQLSTLKNQLLSNLDTAVPSYQAARQGAFHLFGADNALDAGVNILKTSANPAQIEAAVQGMTPLQKNAISYGAATAIVQKAINSGDSRNVVNLFNTPAIRQKLQAVMGPDKATGLEAWLRAENAMNVLKTAVGGNSTTTEQAGDLLGMAAKSFTGPVAGVALGAAEAYREEGFDPELMLKYGALGFMGGALRKYSTGVNEKVTQSIAHNLASNDPKVINAAIRRISQNQNLMQGWREITNRIVGLPAVAARPQGDQSSPAPAYAKGGRVEPTEAQKAVGNYKKDHIRIHGLDVTIENPKGSERKGVHDGKPWRVKMRHAYGYLRGTTGADGDHVDCYVGPHESSDKIFVVDQKNIKTGEFDEHKVMLGFTSKGAAMNGYCGGFSDGKGHKRIMKITPMNANEFKTWLGEGDMRKPMSAAA